MTVLLFPFFVVFLAFKNAESWLRIAMEAFGAHAVILSLVVINLIIGTALYHEQQQRKLVQKNLDKLEKNLQTHKTFWNNILKEFPDHQTALKAKAGLEK